MTGSAAFHGGVEEIEWMKAVPLAAVEGGATVPGDRSKDGRLIYCWSFRTLVE